METCLCCGVEIEEDAIYVGLIPDEKFCSPECIDEYESWLAGMPADLTETDSDSPAC